MATHDVTTGSSAQPWNAHEAVSIMTFSYDAAAHGGVSGDDYKVLDIPQGAVILTIEVNSVGGADVGDTVSMGTSAGGTNILNAETVGATVTATQLTFTSNILMGAGEGLWIRPGATLTAATVTGKVVVAYTNLYTP